MTESLGSSSLQLKTILSHNRLKATSDKQICYVLLDVSPVTDLPTQRLPVNLSLVLDRSTSMQGIRLQQVKEATRQIIDYLEPYDIFSLVVFSDRAEVLLPGQSNIDKARAKSAASTISASGGTEMLQGLTAGLKEIQTNRTEQTVNHIILLTDGQTYGDEEECRQRAEWAGQNQISMSTMGIGSDWNEELLDDMASSSGGVSTYIDTPRKTVDVFKSTIRELSTIVAKETILTIDPVADVMVKEAFQITPHIRRLEVKANRALLGPLGTANRKTILLELLISGLNDPGTKTLLRLTVEGDVPAQNSSHNKRWTEIQAAITEDPDINISVPPTIITTMGKLAIFKMQEKAMQDLEAGKLADATQRLETMATRLLNLGETDLARAALLEAGRLSRTGDLSSEGRKKIRYGTRSLSILPKELGND